MEYFQFTFLFSFVTGILSPFSLKSYISGFPNKSVCEIWKVIIMSSSTLPSYSSSSFRLWYKTFTTQHTLVTLSITHQTRAKVVQKETFLKVKWHKYFKSNDKHLWSWFLLGWHQLSPWMFLSCPSASCTPPWGSEHPECSCYIWLDREQCQSACTVPRFQTMMGWTKTALCARHT